jgi:hypothetical protein
MADKPKPGHTPARLPQDAVPTVRPVRAPVVLVLGGPDELVEAARRVAKAEAPSIAVEVRGAVNSASAVANLRPFALVMSQDIYGFDPEEFTALARDIQADLVVLKVTQKNVGFLEQALRPSLRNAFRRFRTETESGPVRRK